MIFPDGSKYDGEWKDDKKKTDKVYILGLMPQNMTGSGKMMNAMDTVYILILMAENMMENGRMINATDAV